MLLESNDLIEEGEDQPDKIKPVQVKYEQAEDWSNPNWDPEPIDAAPGSLRRSVQLSWRSAGVESSFTITEFHSQKASDIISTFVGMYESREVIMIEVQQWLAKRLLDAKDYDVDAMVCLLSLWRALHGLCCTVVYD
jgi:anaphase-promoting complex subunit 2